MPPPPAEPSSVLRHPDPVAPGEPRGPATLLQGVSLGFAVDLADTAQWGDVLLTGTVTAIDSAQVLFETDQGQPGRLLYRLPPAADLMLDSGYPLTLERFLTGYGSKSGYKIQLVSGTDLILDAGSIPAGSAIHVPIADNLLLRQVERGDVPLDGIDRVLPRAQALLNAPPDTAVVDSTSRPLHLEVPVILGVGTQQLLVASGDTTSFPYNDVDYLLLLRWSGKAAPWVTTELETGSNGLEYVVASK